jgi:hypothetical protein
MQKTLQNSQTALDKTSNLVYNTDMTNNNNTNESNEMKSTTMTYREWLIARNESMTQEDKEEATRAYMVIERAALVARDKAKNWNPS